MSVPIGVYLACYSLCRFQKAPPGKQKAESERNVGGVAGSMEQRTPFQIFAFVLEKKIGREQ